jgi:hypothetical protein
MQRRDVSFWILLLLGLGGIANGLIMLFASEPWFANVAARTGPFNRHLVQDVGVAFLTAGIASVWAARRPEWRTPLATAAALFIGLHGVIHLAEVAVGAVSPAHLLEDFPGVYLPALLLGAIAVRSARAARA